MGTLSFRFPSYFLSNPLSNPQSTAQMHTAPSSAGKPDICVVSSDDSQYLLHSSHLRLGSSVFRDMLETAAPSDTVEGLPSAKITEDAALLDRFFPFFYFDKPLDLLQGDFDELMAIIKVAIKYDTPRAVEIVLHTFMQKYA